MRTFSNFSEALNEISRDLAEMGIIVHPKSYQDKNVEGDPQFDTLEIQNYIYSVTRPQFIDLNPTQPWAASEWAERESGINGVPVNPGQAWRLRPDVWEAFLNDDEEFAYSYSERLSAYNQVNRVIEELKTNPDSRQCLISIWDTPYIQDIGGKSRVPCSIGYQVMIRRGQLHLTYIQRSADFVTHFENDIWLAFRMQQYIADRLGIPVGIYCHHIFSLHMFRKDSVGIF